MSGFEHDARAEFLVGCIDFGFGGSTADEVLAAMQKFRAEVLPLIWYERR